jgi:peroxiredoxin
LDSTLLFFGIVLPWLFVTLGCWIGYHLIRQNGRILLYLQALEQRLAQLSVAPQVAQAPFLTAGLPLGSPAPEFVLPDLKGERQALADFRGQKLLLIFVNPLCGFCTQMAPELATLPTDGADGRPVPLVVTTGDVPTNREFVEEHGIRCQVLLQEGMEVASQFQALGTPVGYLIDEQGNIASELAVGAHALLALAGAQAIGASGRNGLAPLGGTRSVTQSKINRSGLPVGTPAPDFQLPRLDGGELSLEAYRGRRVLLVFSDPKCSPCDHLMPALERVAAQMRDLQVLMVSRGDTKANRAKVAEHGLTFPVGLQRQWEISRAYGMFATPIAYLIDEDGIIAAEAAVGVEPILALLSRAAVSTNGKTDSPPRGEVVATHRR